MRRSTRSLIILALAWVVIVIPRSVLADDCSNLQDCWGVITAALLAMLAIALLITALIILFPEILGLLGLGDLFLLEEAAFLEEAAIVEEVATAEEAVALEEAAAEATEAEAAEAGLTPEEVVADAEKNFRMRAAEEKLPFNLKTINEVGGDLNCPDTSVAVEASLRGTPRVATTTSQVLTNEEMEAVLGRTFEPADSFAEIETQLENLGPGSRGIIRVAPMDGGMGHVYNVANIDGEVIWIDGQRGLASTNAADLGWDTHWVTDFMQTWPP